MVITQRSTVIRPTVGTLDAAAPWMLWSTGERRRDGDRVVLSGEPSANDLDGYHLVTHHRAEWATIRLSRAEQGDRAARAVRAYRGGAERDELRALITRRHAEDVFAAWRVARPDDPRLSSTDWDRGFWDVLGHQIVPYDHPDERCRRFREEWWELLRDGLVDLGGATIDPAERWFRAPLGTPVPEGWAEVPADPSTTGDTGPWWSPGTWSRGHVEHVFGEHWFVPAMLSTVLVREQVDGRWAYGPGDDGGVTWGVADTAAEAEQAATTRMRHAQVEAWAAARERCGGSLDWVHWPEEPPPIDVRTQRRPFAGMLGIAEVAELLGVQRSTVTSYLARAQMPEPDAHWGRSPLWHLATITGWKRAGQGARTDLSG